jgi:hypothetical protein
MFDLGAARAARREAMGDAPKFTFEGHDYVLPVEMSYSAAVSLQQNDLDAGLVHLLGAENYDKFMESEPAMEDIVNLIEWIGSEYEGRNVSTEPAETDTATSDKGSGRGKASRSKS